MVVYNSDISLLKNVKKDKEKLSNSKNSTRFINDLMRKSEATKFILENYQECLLRDRTALGLLRLMAE